MYNGYSTVGIACILAHFTLHPPPYSGVLHIPKLRNHNKWHIIVKRNNRAFQWYQMQGKWVGNKREIVSQTWVSKLFLRSLYSQGKYQGHSFYSPSVFKGTVRFCDPTVHMYEFKQSAALINICCYDKNNCPKCHLFLRSKINNTFDLKFVNIFIFSECALSCENGGTLDNGTCQCECDQNWSGTNMFSWVK